MSRRFWQVVEDPEYIEDWSDYYLDEEDRQRGQFAQHQIPTIKFNGEEVSFADNNRKIV
jgi:hypothetical protein